MSGPMKWELIHWISWAVNSSHPRGAQPPEVTWICGESSCGWCQLWEGLGCTWVPQGSSSSRLSLGPRSLQPWALLTQLQGAQLWDPLAGELLSASQCSGRSFPSASGRDAGMGCSQASSSSPWRAGKAAGTPLLSIPCTGSVAIPKCPGLLIPPSLKSPPCRALVPLQAAASLSLAAGRVKGKDANSITHPSRFAPLKIRFGLGTCLCSCTSR